ncbi:MAG: RNA polymerase factor sigma-54, partial [Gallionella sp.]|nr:RNA polymerase factor sigma-54 [Gallionella sp.]
MKPALQLRQSQQLMMTPQLQQAIKLLQLSTLEINQETARLLDENPFLEREDDNGNQTYSGSTEATSSGSNDNPAPETESRASEADWPEPSFSSSPSSNPDD